MTAVRQKSQKSARKTSTKKAALHQPAATLGPGRPAQVRLRSEEVAALREVMQTLHIDSTSDALREGLRLLSKEAAEISAAEDIRAFYNGQPIPLPEGTAVPIAAELTAADEMHW